MSGYAPYNFIPFDTQIEVNDPYANEDELPSFGTYRENGISGYIDYEFENLTPIAVQAPTEKNNPQFFKNGRGEYTIPGSTMRGFTRSHSEILSFSDISDMVQDERYQYRSFADKAKKLRKAYNEELNSLNNMFHLPNGVSVGMLYVKSGKGNEKKYYIKPVNPLPGTTTTFVRVHESALIRMNALRNSERMYSCDIEKYDEKKHGPDKKKFLRELFKDRNIGYKPYRRKIYFALAGTKVFNVATAFSQQSPNAGILLNSGFIEGKTHHYVVSMDEMDTQIDIDEDLVSAYKRDLERNAVQNVNLRTDRGPGFYGLPEDSKKPVPFFYKTDGANHVRGFGPTPYFRITYKTRVHEAIPSNLKKDGKRMDYVQSMYGFAESAKGENSRAAYKSRLSFQNAIAVKNDKSQEQIERFAVGTPRGTSFQIYLDQKDDIPAHLSDFNDPAPVLAGYKIYFKRKELYKTQIPDNIKADQYKLDNRFPATMTLKKGNTFKGRIYFENLSKEELGLLFMSLQIGDDKAKETYNIGKGKPIGLGKIKFKRIDVYQYDLDEMLGSLDLSERVATLIDGETLKAYKKAYIKALADDDFYTSPTTNDYWDFVELGEADRYLNETPNLYMKLGEYRNREPLDTIVSILEDLR